MTRKIKAINFDLDTAKLKAAYPNKSYKNAYADIKKVLQENGFEHRQGSGYVSKEKCTQADISVLAKKLHQFLPWLKDCINKVDVTDVAKQYDITNLIKTANSEESKERHIPNIQQSTFDEKASEGEDAGRDGHDGQTGQAGLDLAKNDRVGKKDKAARRGRDDEMER